MDTPSIGAFDIVSFDGALFSNSMEVPTVVALLGIFQLGGKTTRPGYEVTQLDTYGIHWVPPAAWRRGTKGRFASKTIGSYATGFETFGSEGYAFEKIPKVANLFS